MALRVTGIRGHKRQHFQILGVRNAVGARGTGKKAIGALRAFQTTALKCDNFAPRMHFLLLLHFTAFSTCAFFTAVNN
jgi:hypothetical protein